MFGVNLALIVEGIKAGVKLAREIKPIFDEFEDIDLEHNVYGLSAMSRDIRLLVSSNNFDKEKFLQIANNIEDINSMQNKFSKLIK
jgi:hypothetical protein